MNLAAGSQEARLEEDDSGNICRISFKWSIDGVFRVGEVLRFSVQPKPRAYFEILAICVPERVISVRLKSGPISSLSRVIRTGKLWPSYYTGYFDAPCCSRH